MDITEPKNLQRDFIGYGRVPPQPEWPGNTQLALNFVINLEEGAESCILDGDAASENYLMELSGRKPLIGQRDLFSESIFEYGARCGIWRLLNLFETRGLPLTLWVCGQALERNPALAAHLAASSHEVAGHGYRWIDYRGVQPNLEREHIVRTLEIIERLIGRPAVGWYTGRKSLNTRRLIAEAGLRYDSESYADDLPYWVEVNSRPHLVIPYSFDANDAKYFLSPGWTSGDDFLQYLQNTIRCLYREGEASPKMMTVALHARISGRPGRAEIIYRFLDFLEQFPNIWITTREAIAQLWYQQHPAKTLET